MAKANTIVGLDIGSTAVRIVVAQEGAEGKLQIIGAAQTASEGINKGKITSLEDATSSLSSALEKVERLTGLPVSSAWVGISGSHIVAQKSKGVVAVSRSNGEVSGEDVDRAMEAARTVAVPPNHEILHVVPHSFNIDNQIGVKDPVGMTGIRLEVEAQIIQGLSSQIKNLTKCIYRTGLDIEDLVLSILANAEGTLTDRQKELGVGLVNIGGPTSSLAIFEEGDLLHTAVLPIGSEHITSDIAIGLRTSIDTAEKIKLEHGTVLTKGIAKKEEINLEEVDEAESESVSRKYVAEIIEARAEEILEKVNQEFKKVDRAGMLPSGVVLTGGGAKLPGLVELAKKKLKLPVSLGFPQGVISAIDRVDDLSFTTAVGLVMWGAEANTQKKGLSKIMPRFKSVDQASDRIKKWFKALLP